MNEQKIARIASVIAAAYDDKPGYALLFATTIITHCMEADDYNGFSLWRQIGMVVANMEMISLGTDDPAPVHSWSPAGFLQRH